MTQLTQPTGPAVAPPGSPARPRRPIGALSALTVSMLAVLGSVFVDTWPVAVATIAAELVLAAAVVGRFGSFARRMGPGLLAAASVGFSSWLLGGHDPLVGLTAGLRIVVLVLPGMALVEYVEPSALGDALAQRLHLPARPVVASVAALQRLESLGQDWVALDRARRARGLGPGRSPVARARHVAGLTFGLLVESLRRSARMAVAMDARGFAAAHRRSWAEPSRWGRPDTVLLLAGLLVSALPIMLRGLL